MCFGRPPKEMDPAQYVLKDFDQIEQLRLDGIPSHAVEALKVMLLEGLQTAMNRHQKKSRTEG